jgi:hypothetical protein
MTLDEVWHDPILNLFNPKTNQLPLGGIKCMVQNIEKNASTYIRPQFHPIQMNLQTLLAFSHLYKT